MLRIAGRSFIGASKSVNQDAYCALSAQAASGEAALVAVCDGVGGLSSGEVASSAAARELAGWFEHDFARMVSARPEPVSCLAAAQIGLTHLLDDLNESIWRYGRSLNVRLATTLTALLIYQGLYLTVHVGDCRAYLCRGGSVSRLTRDQTLIQGEVDAGRIGAEEALLHPKGSVILQALGARELLSPVFGTGELVGGDLLLLCSDGLYRRQGPGGVGTRMACAGATEPELLDALGELIASALDAGEKDNITGVMLRVVGAPRPAAAHASPVPALVPVLAPAPGRALRPARSEEPPVPRARLSVGTCALRPWDAMRPEDDERTECLGSVE